jgi:predicted dehydrogenase
MSEKEGQVPMSQGEKKRYAFVGMGGRVVTFVRAVAETYNDRCEVAAFCDINPARLEFHNKRLQEVHNHPPVPTYLSDDFEKMIEEQKVDVVVVTTVDSLHHEYVIRAMDAGCDAICEKPMTIDAEKARAIQDAIRRTGKQLRVTFNVRYQPISTKARELIMQGVIGQPLAVSLTYMLDTRHGANYFRRWHREKDKSGGLLIHKATHQFDLVNWLVDSEPESVFAMGSVSFYGREAAEARGENTHPGAGTENDPFNLKTETTEQAPPVDKAQLGIGHISDKSVFAEGITSEDTATVVTRYKNGVLFNYSLVAYAPQEGFDLYITGTRGRIEIVRRHRPHAPNHVVEEGSDDPYMNEANDSITLRVFPMFQMPYEVEVPQIEGGHGGGDARLADDLFSGDQNIHDPFGRLASYKDGLLSMAIGAAANESIATGKLVRVEDIIKVD